MNILNIHSIMTRGFPGTNITEIGSIINEAIDDGEDELKGTKFEYLDIVDGKRFYKPKGSAIDVVSILFQNTSGNFIPINRFIGKTNTGEIE